MTARAQKEISPELQALFLFLKSDRDVSGKRVHLIKLETRGQDGNGDSVWRFSVDGVEKLIPLSELAEWVKQKSITSAA